MRNILIPILLVLTFLYLSASGQPGEISNLRNVIKQQQQQKNYEKDTSYLLNIAKLAHLYYSLNADSIFYYANLSLKLSKQIGYQKGIAEGLRQLGNANMLTGDRPQALACYQQSLDAAVKIPDKLLECYALSNIGLLYLDMKKFDEALPYNQKAYNMAKEVNDSVRLAGEMNNLGEIYAGLGQYDTAINYQRQALQMAHYLNNEYYEAYLADDMGNMLISTGKYAEALTYLRKAAAYYQKTNDRLGLTTSNLSIAKVYREQQKNDSAIAAAQLSLRLAEELKSKQNITDAARLLADIYEARGNTQSALQFLHLYTQYSDSLFNEETQKKLFELQIKYKYEREETRLKETQAKKDLENSQKLQGQRMQIIIAGLIILMLFILVMALNKSRVDKQKNNRLLQRMNTEILQQKEALEIQASKLERANAHKDKLFSTLAHDLRGPFVSLQSLLKLLNQGNLPAGQEKAIFSKLGENVDYTVNLINNLLNWSSGQIKGTTVKPVTLNIHAVVSDSINGIETTAQEKGITLHNATPGDINVFADADMVYAILRNLLSNAVKFCSTGDTITVEAEAVDGMAQICVRDTGTGITPDIMQKINKGESVTTYGTSKEKGTGLGLLLCKDFAERNNGRLWVKSHAGEGSSFYFTLKTVDQA